MIIFGICRAGDLVRWLQFFVKALPSIGQSLSLKEAEPSPAISVRPENLPRHDRFGRPLAPLAAPRLAGGCRRVRSSLPAGLSGGLRCEPAAPFPQCRVLRASSESPVSQPPQLHLPVHTLPGARTDPAASRTRLSHASEMQSDSDSGLPSVLLPVGGMYCCEAPLVGGARLLAVSARRAALCGERCAPVPSLQFPRWRMSL